MSKYNDKYSSGGTEVITLPEGLIVNKDTIATPSSGTITYIHNTDNSIFDVHQDGTYASNTGVFPYNMEYDSFTKTGEPFEVPNTSKCTSCKEDGVHIVRRYNWGDNDKLVRKICNKCHCRALDKIYSTDRNIDTEETLYGKKD